MVWHYSFIVVFSIKSIYDIVCDRVGQSLHSIYTVSLWKSWFGSWCEVKASPKVFHLLWRCFHGVVEVQYSLIHCHCHVEVLSCSLCDDFWEIVAHLLVGCQSIKFILNTLYHGFSIHQYGNCSFLKFYKDFFPMDTSQTW